MKNTKQQIFETIYQWGRVGVVVDWEAPTIQRYFNELEKETLEKVISIVQEEVARSDKHSIAPLQRIMIKLMEIKYE